MTIYDLAELLHNNLCHWNHTDGCTWLYEGDQGYPVKTWEAYSHKKWLAKAEEIYARTGLEFEDIARVIKAL
jgi:hypothetical protein